MDEPTRRALDRWRDHTYRSTDIPFTKAVYSLSLGSEPLIEARQSDTRPSEWIVRSLVSVRLGDVPETR